MKKILVLILSLGVFTFALGDLSDNLRRYVLTDGVIQKEPAPERSSYYLGEKAVLFTEFRDIGPEERVVLHNWYFIENDGSEILAASVPLSVKGYRWRTWSSKNLNRRGGWEVKVLDEEENILGSKRFRVE